MSDFSILGGSTSRFEHLSADASLGVGQPIVPSGTAHSKGSYTQLVASTGFDYNQVTLSIRNPTTDDSYLVDIAIGASSSEIIIIENLLVGNTASTLTRFMHTITFPISVPAGTRISARVQASSTSTTTVFVSIMGAASPLSASSELSKITTYGANTSDTNGTVVDPGAVADTKGSYAQISASISDEIKGIMINASMRGNTAAATANFMIDIAVGAAASEVIILPDFMYTTVASVDLVTPAWFYYPISIPVGSRVAIRSQSSTTNSTDRLLDFVLYGVS